jgi:tetratricopeptide (TPR) repeat protein
LRTYRAKLQLALAQSQLYHREGIYPLQDIYDIKEHYLIILAPNNPERLEAITYHYWACDWTFAEDLHVQHDVVETLQMQDGFNLSFLTLKAMEVLAKMYEAHRQLDKAIDLLSTTLRHRALLHGQNHIITLETKESLLFLKSKQDRLSLRPGDPRYHEMAKQVEDLVMQRMSLQGPDHPGTLNAQASLAKFYEDHNQYHQALPVYQAIIKGWTRRNGAHNLNTVIACEILAELHEKLGNREDAIMQWKHVVEGYGETETIYKDDLRHAVVSLARLYEMAERYDDEAVMWDQFSNDFKLVEKELKPYEVPKMVRETMEAMGALAKQFEKLARHDDAVAQWKRIIGVAMISYGHGVCEYTASLAELFHRLGRDDDAVAQREATLKWTMDHKWDYRVVCNLEFLARQLEKLGRYDKAVPVWKKFIRKWDYSSDICNPIRPLAEALEKIGRHKEAAIQWERAFKWDGLAPCDERDEEDRFFEMELAVKAYEKVGLMDKAEAIRERKRKWKEHLRWRDEMKKRGKYVEMDLDILGADQEEQDRDDE